MRQPWHLFVFFCAPAPVLALASAPVLALAPAPVPVPLTPVFAATGATGTAEQSRNLFIVCNWMMFHRVVK